MFMSETLSKLVYKRPCSLQVNSSIIPALFDFAFSVKSKSFLVIIDPAITAQFYNVTMSAIIKKS